MKLFKKAKKGFTLVELVVVIAVIAILSAVSVGAYFGITESAKGSNADREARALHTALMVIGNDPTRDTKVTSEGLTAVENEPASGDVEEVLGTAKELLAETGITYTITADANFNGTVAANLALPHIYIDSYDVADPEIAYISADKVVRYITISTGAISPNPAA